MATCPKCMGPLTEHHRCPPRLFRRMLEALTTVGAGAVLGGALVFGLEERPAGALVLAAAALGAVLANAVRQAIEGRRP